MGLEAPGCPWPSALNPLWVKPQGHISLTDQGELQALLLQGPSDAGLYLVRWAARLSGQSSGQAFQFWNRFFQLGNMTCVRSGTLSLPDPDQGHPTQANNSVDPPTSSTPPPPLFPICKMGVQRLSWG